MKSKVTGLIALLALAAVPALALADTTETTKNATDHAIRTVVTHTTDPVVRFNAIDGQPLR